MHKLTGSCHMCGMCCKAIVLNVTMEEIERYEVVKKYKNGKIPEEGAKDYDPLFVYLYWTANNPRRSNNH